MLNVFDSADKKRVKNHIRNLIHIANVDGHFDESEKAIVHKMARKFGLTDEELETMIKEDENYDYIPPVDLKERFELLYDFMMMMTVDNQLVHSEIKLFKSLALGLNINHTKVDEITKYLFEMSPKVKNPDELFKGFKKVLLS